MALIHCPRIESGYEIETMHAYVIDVETKDVDGKPMCARIAVTHDCLKKACEAGPKAVWDIVSHELAGVFKSIQGRAENRPMVGSRASHRGRTGMIMMVDRSNPLGPLVEIRDSSGWSIKAAWAECEWA